MTALRSRFRRVSVHEAGHAVAARRLGLRVRGLEVFADGSGGRCEVFSARLSRPDRAWAIAVIALAGPIAEGLYRGVPPETLTSFATDGRRVLAVAPADPGERAVFCEEAALEADRLVRDPDTWREVRKVAGRLFRSVGTESG